MVGDEPDELAVVVEAGLPDQVEAGSLSGDRDVLVAVQAHANRPAGDGRAERRDRREPVRLRLFAAEATPHAQRLHGDRVVAQAENVGDDLLGFTRMLGAALDVELPAFVEVRQRCVGLEIEMLLAEVLVVTFEDVRGIGKGGLDVSATRHPRCSLERSGLDRFRDGDQRRQRLVVDLDRRGTETGGLRRLGQNPAHRVSVVHHLTGEERFVAEDAGLIALGHVLRRQHVHHTGHREGGLGAHRGDSRVSVGRLHRPRGQGVRPAEGDVVGVPGGARHVTDRTLVGFRDADEGVVRDGRQVAHPATSSSADSAWSLRRDCDNMIARYSALARWSLIGVPSRPRVAAAVRAVSRVHG